MCWFFGVVSLIMVPSGFEGVFGADLGGVNNPRIFHGI